jgi:uncharacterized protein (TIGR00251 family)
VRLYLTVSPGARRNEIEELAGGELRVRVAAPAVDDKANRALAVFLAEWLGVPPSRVLLVKGGSSRHKVVEIEGLAEQDVRARLRGPRRREG